MAKYEGEWKDNQFNGYGIYYFPDGKKYVGEWKNSCKDGFGEFDFADGRKYVGFYKEDKKDGFGIFYLNDNNFSLNFWKNGKRNGLGKCFEGNDVNYQIWEDNKIIKEDMDEFEFMSNFGKELINYRFFFEMNNKELIKLIEI